MGVTGLADSILSGFRHDDAKEANRRAAIDRNVNQAAQGIGGAIGGLVQMGQARAENPEFNVDPETRGSSDRLTLARELGFGDMVSSKGKKDEKTGKIGEDIKLEAEFSRIEDAKRVLATKASSMSQKREARANLREARRNININLPSLSELRAEQARRAREDELKLKAAREGLDSGVDKDDLERIKQTDRVIQNEKTKTQKQFGEEGGAAVINLRSRLNNIGVPARAAAVIDSRMANAFNELGERSLKQAIVKRQNLLQAEANEITSGFTTDKSGKRVKLSPEQQQLRMAGLIKRSASLLDGTNAKEMITKDLAMDIASKQGIGPDSGVYNGAQMKTAIDAIANTVDSVLVSSRGIDLDDVAENAFRDTIEDMEAASGKLGVPVKRKGIIGGMKDFFGIDKDEEQTTESLKRGVFSSPTAKKLSGPNGRNLIRQAVRTNTGEVADFLKVWMEISGSRSVAEAGRDFLQKKREIDNEVRVAKATGSGPNVGPSLSGPKSGSSVAKKERKTDVIQAGLF